MSLKDDVKSVKSEKNKIVCKTTLTFEILLEKVKRKFKLFSIKCNFPINDYKYYYMKQMYVGKTSVALETFTSFEWVKIMCIDVHFYTTTNIITKKSNKYWICKRIRRYTRSLNQNYWINAMTYLVSVVIHSKFCIYFENRRYRYVNSVSHNWIRIFLYSTHSPSNFNVIQWNVFWCAWANKK